jgi:hypothetical protein
LVVDYRTDLNHFTYAESHYSFIHVFKRGFFAILLVEGVLEVNGKVFAFTARAFVDIVLADELALAVGLLVTLTWVYFRLLAHDFVECFLQHFWFSNKV